MADSANRDVIYTLRVQQDPAAKRQLEEWGGRLKAVDAEALRSTKETAKTQQDEHAKVFQNRLKLLDRMAKEEQKKRDAAFKADQKAAQETAKAYEQAMGKLTASQGKLRETLNMGSEGVLKLGRGFAMLGLSGEENTKKLLEGLVKVQAISDLVRGGIETYIAITDSVKAYRSAVLAATAAETALGAARARSAAAGGVNAASGAANMAASSGPAVLGLGATVAAFVAAVGSVTAATKILGETLTGASEEAGSWSMSVRNSYAWLADAAFGSDFSGDKAGKMSAMQGARMQMQGELNDQVITQRLRARQGASDARLDLLSGQMDPNASRRQRQRLERGELGRIDEQLRAINTGESRGGEQARQALLDRQAELLRRQSDYLREELDVAKEAADKKIEAARMSREAAESEVKLREDLIRKEEDRLLSAKERFGQLSAEEQARLIRTKKKADAGGDLSREERSLLRSVGTAGATGIARAGDLAAADAAGFDTVFGAQERANIASAQADKANLQVRIADSKKIEVQVQQNYDQLANRIAQDVEAAVARAADALEEAVQNQLRISEQKMTQDANNRLKQEYASINGA